MQFPTQQLSDLFWSSPVGKSLVKEANKERDEKRRAAEKAIVEINAREAKEMPLLAKKRAAAESEFVRAREALKIAEQKRAAASHAMLGGQHQIDTQRARHEKFLTETATGELHPFLNRLDAERERLTEREAYQTKRMAETTGYSIEAGALHALVVKDNMPQIAAKVEYLVEAGRKAEKLAATKAEITDALDELLAGIPSHDLPAKGAK